MNKLYINKKLVANESLSELDFVFYDEFGFDYDKYEQLVEIQSKNDHGYASAEPISIDNLIKILQTFKANGATHVEIEDNCDHNGYDISAYKISLSSEQDIINYEEEKENEISKKKKQKIDELQKEIDRLSKS